MWSGLGSVHRRNGRFAWSVRKWEIDSSEHQVWSDCDQNLKNHSGKSVDPDKDLGDELTKSLNSLNPGFEPMLDKAES